MSNFTNYTPSVIESLLNAYAPVHMPIVVAICTFGITTNLLLLFVLTRPSMTRQGTAGATINVLLTGLSFAQLCLLVSMLLYTIYGKLDALCVLKTKSYTVVACILVVVNLNVLFHTIALVHTTLLASFRFVAVSFAASRLNQAVVGSVHGTRLTVAAVYALVPLVCTPMFASYEVAPLSVEHREFIVTTCRFADAASVQIYRIQFTDWAKRSGLLTYNLWFFAIACKIIPGLILVALSVELIRRLREFNRNRAKLFSASRTSRQQEDWSVTLMLVVVMSLFVVVELPQGVLSVLGATMGEAFRTSVYVRSGDFFEMCTVAYSSLNFVLYCLMNRHFRIAFFNAVVPRRFQKAIDATPVAARAAVAGAHNDVSNVVALKGTTLSPPRYADMRVNKALSHLSGGESSSVTVVLP